MIKIKFEKEKNKSIAYQNNVQIGECVFTENNEYWNIVHTQVNNSYRGKGIARELVEIVIKEAKLHNKKIIADCSYAKKILERQ